MEKNEFLNLADTCLEAVATWLEDFDPDEVDFTTTDGVVAIEFPNGDKFILNRQAAADQMWFAAGVRAWHYDRDTTSGTWLCDKDGHELFARIGEAISERIGRTVSP
ncbi:MAG: CyaY protein [Planctomycetota bacterium]|jgi:CyaY protein